MIFVNRSLSEKYGLDENTRYIAFYNTSGTQIWAEYESTWSRAVHDVNTEWSKVFIENDPTIEEVDFENTFKYTKIFFQRIKDVVEGYKYNDDNDEVPRMSDTMRAEIDYLMSSRSIQKDDVDALFLLDVRDALLHSFLVSALYRPSLPTSHSLNASTTSISAPLSTMRVCPCRPSFFSICLAFLISATAARYVVRMEERHSFSSAPL